jgi:DNA-binding response OmpR family regulator
MGDPLPADDGDVIDLPEAPDTIMYGPLWLSPSHLCEIRLRGEPIPMTVSKIQMIARLLGAEGAVVSREDLYLAAHGEALPKRSRAVDVEVCRVRQMLGDLGRFIITVRDRGYRMDVFGLRRSG